MAKVVIWPFHVKKKEALFSIRWIQKRQICGTLFYHILCIFSFLRGVKSNKVNVFYILISSTSF